MPCCWCRCSWCCWLCCCCCCCCSCSGSCCSCSSSSSSSSSCCCCCCCCCCSGCCCCCCCSRCCSLSKHLLNISLVQVMMGDQKEIVTIRICLPTKTHKIHGICTYILSNSMFFCRQICYTHANLPFDWSSQMGPNSMTPFSFEGKWFKPVSTQHVTWCFPVSHRWHTLPV